MLASSLASTPRLIVGKLNAALNSDDVHVRAGEKIGRKREVTVFCSKREIAMLRSFYSKTAIRLRVDRRPVAE